MGCHVITGTEHDVLTSSGSLGLPHWCGPIGKRDIRPQGFLPCQRVLTLAHDPSLWMVLHRLLRAGKVRGMVLNI